MTRQPVVIIGGGLTGLVAAHRLEEQRHSALVLEREAEPGGACRSIRAGDFVFDYTGHLLHIQRPETRRYLEDLGVWQKLAAHERRAAIHVQGTTTPYPIQIHTWGLPAELRRHCLLGFIRAWAAREQRADPKNFEQWVLDRFGAGLAKVFFFPYNQKLFRARPEELSLDWVGRYVPKPDLEEVVDGALGLHDEAVGYNASFYYPRTGGIRMLPDAVARRIDGLELDAEVTAIHLAERWLELKDGRRVAWDRLVSTVSLHAAVDLVQDVLPDDVREAREALRWVRVLNIALGVAGAAPRPEHWLYFPEPELPFYRVGFPSNHGDVAPSGHHSVSVEISLKPGEGSPTEVAEHAEEALAAAGYLDRHAVRVRRLTVLDPSYVVFDHRRRDAVSRLRRFFSQRGVMLAGRWAEWKYSAMEDAILDGFSVARRIHGR